VRGVALPSGRRQRGTINLSADRARDCRLLGVRKSTEVLHAETGMNEPSVLMVVPAERPGRFFDASFLPLRAANLRSLCGLVLMRFEVPADVAHGGKSIGARIALFSGRRRECGTRGRAGRSRARRYRNWSGKFRYERRALRLGAAPRSGEGAGTPLQPLFTLAEFYSSRGGAAPVLAHPSCQLSLDFGFDPFFGDVSQLLSQARGAIEASEFEILERHLGAFQEVLKGRRLVTHVVRASDRAAPV
jgi:hypothetical protein